MPRKSSVRTFYQKVSRPRKKVEKKPDFLFREEKSPLVRYVEENRESGLSVRELIEQFQEYDCVHEEWILASSSKVEIRTCSVCRMVQRKLKVKK